MKTLLTLIPLAGMLLGTTSNTFAFRLESSSIHHVIPTTPFQERMAAQPRTASNRQQMASRSAPVVYPNLSLGQMFTPRIEDGLRTSIQDSPNFVKRTSSSGSVGGQSPSVFQPSPKPSISHQNHRTQSFDTPKPTQQFSFVHDSEDSASSETPNAPTTGQGHRPSTTDIRSILSNSFQNNVHSQHRPSTTTVPSATGQNNKHSQQHRPSSTVVPSVTGQASKPSQELRPPSTQASSVIGQGSKPSPDPQAPHRNPMCFDELDYGTCRAALARYYYDQKTGTCNCFLFGGCREHGEGESPGSFLTLQECQRECRPPKHEEGPTCKEIFRDDHFVSFLKPIPPPPAKGINPNFNEEEYFRDLIVGQGPI